MWIQPFFDPEKYPLGNLTIDTTKSYAVIINQYSKGKWRNINPDYLGGSASLPGQLLTMAQNIKDTFTSTENQVAPLSVAIVPISDMNKYCDIQAS